MQYNLGNSSRYIGWSLSKVAQQQLHSLLFLFILTIALWNMSLGLRIAINVTDASVPSIRVPKSKVKLVHNISEKFAFISVVAADADAVVDLVVVVVVGNRKN